jgi:hypothetical protein
MGNTNSDAVADLFRTELEKKEKKQPTVEGQHQLKIEYYKDVKFIKYDKNG